MVKGLGGAQRHNIALAKGEATGEQSASLSWGVELELVVGSDISGTTLGVKSRAVFKRDDESSLGTAAPAVLGDASLFLRYSSDRDLEFAIETPCAAGGSGASRC